MPPPSPGAVHAMDLFADVLVRADGVTYRVCDLAELDQAHRSGLILPGEADRAWAGLAELTGIIERGDLLAFLSRACPIGPQIRRPPSLPAAYPLPRCRCSAPKAAAPGSGAARCRARSSSAAGSESIRART